MEVTSSSLVPPIVAAPLAQLDRAFDYGSKGWGFESLRAHRDPRHDYMSIDGLAIGRPVLLWWAVRAAIRIGRGGGAAAGWPGLVSGATGGAQRKLAAARDAPFRRDQSPRRALGIDMVNVARDRAVGDLEITH